MATVLIRTASIYLILIMAMRLTGKRQIGELQIAELVVTFMLSELAVYPITDKNASLAHAVLPIILLLSLEVIFSFIQTKSRTARKLFSGGPTVIISQGRLCIEELAKNRLDLEELLGELRLKDIFDISEVEYAILEENGKLSVFLKAPKRPATVEELGVIPIDAGISHPIIIDGKIITGNTYAGGELGHSVIVVDGAKCTCGRRGCYEAYASATGLIRQTKEKMLEVTKLDNSKTITDKGLMIRSLTFFSSSL